ncbi:hypothetical protein [Rosistilla oblonga]
MIDDAKEIEQTAFVERTSDRVGTFTLTKRIALHVRVRDGIVRGAAIGGYRNNIEGGRILDVLPVQSNLEAAEFN